MNLFKIKNDKNYNILINYYMKKINSEIKLASIKQSMVKHLNELTISYWIYKYKKLTPEMKDFYKQLFYENINNVIFKMRILKQKDKMISKTLEQRRLREIERLRSKKLVK